MWSRTVRFAEGWAEQTTNEYVMGQRDEVEQPAGMKWVQPFGLHDLRQGSSVQTLHYPPDDVLVVSGLPGSGKSTLMRRCARAPLVDSQLVREEYETRLPNWVPYPVYRPLVRAEHYWRLRQALRLGGPLVVQDSGALPYVRTWLARTAQSQRRHIHLLVLVTTAHEAMASQCARGRCVSSYAFARHLQAVQALHHLLITTSAPPTGFASTVLIDRAKAIQLREIRFGSI
jgi:predicted kinase